TGAEIVFIDLPFHATIAPTGARDRSPEEVPETPPVEPAAPGAGDGHARESDHYFAASDLYRELARVAGYRTWDEAWDALFEMRTFADYDHYRREMAVFCGGARATTPRALTDTDDTLPRERHMMHMIRATIRRRDMKPNEAAVVCGGFHLFLDRDD